MRLPRYGLVILLCLCGVQQSMASPIPGLAPQKDWDLNGYVKYMGSATYPDSQDNLLDHLLNQRVNFEYRIDKRLRFNLGMRNRLFYGDTSQFPAYGKLVGFDNGYFDLSTNWLDSHGWVGNSQFDRAYLTFSTDEDWQFKLGRFRVNWAMSALWNPNDIFNAYSIYDFDYEERSGTDAIMVSRKLGFASSVELVFNANQDSDLNRYATRFLFNHDGWDMQLIAGKAGTDRVFGAGFAGDIQGAGIRGEWSYFDPIYDNWPEREQVTNPLLSTPSMLPELGFYSTHVATLESDYSFASVRNWILRGSVLYISSPMLADSAQLYLNLPLSARTLSFTQWTYYGEASFDWSALSRVSLSASYYQDGSYFVGASVSYSLANDWQLQFIAQRFDGDIDSLFGQSASTLAFAQVKWSF
ncbi:hypothetical protein K0I73_06070 [Shewanella mesophila]|uniref:hypothetical protein n=1 Tax=Shewanella mesophila TaxID=2864208 RepID=UPI001C65CF45|nr:hypothetical protein [Shewanella mesophila]QYJ87270.1 hypothetical protein K0I73_06070 [Shewanella mesophila]